MKKRVIYWVRNDLRLHDNAILHQLAQHQEVEMLLPVYAIKPSNWEELPLGFPKTGFFRTQFLFQSLEAYRSGMRSLGSDLHLVLGHPADALAELAKSTHATHLYYQKEHAWEEIQEEIALESKTSLQLRSFEGLSLVHPEDLPFTISDLPDVFTNFRKAVEKRKQYVRPVFPLPERLPPFPEGISTGLLPDYQALGLPTEQIDPRCALACTGGEHAALERLNHYLAQDHLSRYKETRNGLLGPDYSSKFSFWLANGSLSARQVYWAVKDYEKHKIKNQSTYWLVFELLWRDFFRFQLMKYGRKFFLLGGVSGQRPVYKNRWEDFLRWKEGKTGNDFVDANMTELAATGFMSNRGRQNVASYLVHQLSIDWRWGAAWFENRLIDYDPASNWGNWLYLAGVGHDPRSRQFNVDFQAEKYDKRRRYRKHWLGTSDSPQTELF